MDLGSENGGNTIMKTIYLDHAATTPIHPDVLRVMMPYLTDEFGNAGAIYALGRRAKVALDASRAKIAKQIGAKPQEIYFTAGGTESDNLAILGYARRRQLKGRIKGHIVTSSIEHHAVLDACKTLEKEGFTVTYLPVDCDGLVTVEQVVRAIRRDTVLVSIMYANNEIGTIEPIAQIGKKIRQLNVTRQAKGLPTVAYHTDACQAAGYLDINVNNLSVDMMTINGSKLYGPKGIGFLYLRRGVQVEPLVYGGGQELGLRSGTENIASIVGLAKALELAQASRTSEVKRLTTLRDYFISKVQKEIPNVILNGHGVKRLPNNINISILGVEGESAVLYLDGKSIACSTGSACTAANLEPSYVIMALGNSHERAHGSLRFTLGRSTSRQDIDATIEVLVKVTKRLREISSLQ
jgi:cysteine desulfurase